MEKIVIVPVLSLQVNCDLEQKKSGSKRLYTQLEIILSAITILTIKEPVDNMYAELRHHLEQSGTPIGPNDMLIAAHALALNLVLVSANLRESTRVPGLTVENWLEIH